MFIELIHEIQIHEINHNTVHVVQHAQVHYFICFTRDGTFDSQSAEKCRRFINYIMYVQHCCWGAMHHTSFPDLKFQFRLFCAFFPTLYHHINLRKIRLQINNTPWQLTYFRTWITLAPKWQVQSNPFCIWFIRLTRYNFLKSEWMTVWNLKVSHHHSLQIALMMTRLRQWWRKIAETAETRLRQKGSFFARPILSSVRRAIQSNLKVRTSTMVMV
jgi:hypothetical protein